VLYSAVVDADTTALMTYGSQEGVARGYIPKRRHTQSSYAPILSSEGRSGLSLGMELRAGNVHSSVGAGEFLGHVLDKLPSSIAAARTRLDWTERSTTGRLSSPWKIKASAMWSWHACTNL
jgi:hypothetical protein